MLKKIELLHIWFDALFANKNFTAYDYSSFICCLIFLQMAFHQHLQKKNLKQLVQFQTHRRRQLSQVTQQS